MRSKKAMLAALVVSAGAVVGIGQVTNTFPIVESACSCPTPTFPPQNTVAPAVVGNIQVGQGVLAATDGTWTHNPTSYTYAWQTSPTGAGSWSALGDTDNSYTLVTGDVGNYIRIEITATNSNGSAIADSNVLGPIQASGGGGSGTGPPSSTLANIWISNTGSDVGANCVRSSVAITEPTASSVCKTMSKAYTLARCGDNVLMDGGTYNSQLLAYTLSKTSGSTGCSNIAGGAGCHYGTPFPQGSTATDLSMCIFFSPKSGQTVTLSQTVNAGQGGSVATGASLDEEASYAYIQGLHLTPRTTNGADAGLRVSGVFSRTGTTASCTDHTTQEVVIDNVSGAANFIVAAPATNVGIVNSDFGPMYDTRVAGGVAAQTSDCHVSGVLYSRVTQLYVKNTTLHDLMQPASGQHTTCWHFNDGYNSYLGGNKFLNCGPLDLELETNFATVGAISYILIENNIFDNACSDTTIGPGDAACNGCTNSCNVNIQNTGTPNSMSNITYRFNSYLTSSGPKFFCINVSGGCTGWPNTISIYGNVLDGPISFSNSSGAGSVYPTTGGTDGYNVANGAALTTGEVDFGGAIDTFYTNSAARTWDFTPALGASSVAHHIVPGTGGYTCPATDILGNARPSTNCTAGAYEE